MAKYNKTIIENICKKLEDGLTRRDTCALVGITEETFSQWNKKPEFSEAVRRAEGLYIEKMTKIVNVKSTTEVTGKRALEILERRRPDDWGEKEKLDLTSGGERVQTIDISSLLEKAYGKSTPDSTDEVSDNS